MSAWALVRIEPKDTKLAKQVAPLFLNALNNDMPVVRIEAANSLGLIGNVLQSGDVKAALREALQDSDPMVQRESVKSSAFANATGVILVTASKIG